MADMTFGQMMLADILPPDIYQPGVAINKKRLNEMMGQVAQRYPDRYADIAHRLVRLGLKSGESMGGASFGLKDLATTPVVRARQEEIRNEMKELLDNTPEDQQQEAIVKLLRRHSKEMPELVYQDGVANKNRFTLQLEGAGRGNKKSLSSMMAGDILVENSVGDPVPVPISRGYGQGQTLGQYYATAYGARRGITTTKLAVGSSGYFCFPASVNVRMADGSVKSIALVAPGDLVLGADVAGNTFPVRVLNRWANGMQAVNRYRVRKLAQRKGHFEFEATPGHEMLVRVDAYYKSRFPVSQAHVEQGTNTRVKLGKCRKLKCRLVLNGPSVTWSGTRNEPYAWVIGYLIGNGGLTSGGVCFSTADAEVLRSFVDVLGSDQFMVNKGRTRDLDYEYRLVDLRPLSKVAVRTTEDLGTHRLRRRLRSLGLIGKKAQEKFIPDEVWSWSKGSICELIAGLLEADGCFSLTQLGSVTMRFSVTSAAISHRLKELMAVVLGVHATSVTEYVCHDTEPGKVIKYKVKSNFNMHELSVTGYENVDRLLKQLPIRGSKIRKSREMFAAREYGSRYTVTASILSELPAGEREVYDLEVDHPDHLYVLESGLVVSNSKLLQQAGHRLVVVGDDDDKADPDEQRGLLVDAADPDNVGALLARDIGPYRRNTVITPSMLTALHRLGNGQVLIRSPIASSSLSGGLYARDVGVREFGRLARRGEHVGNPASQAIGEQVQQMSLCLAEGTLVRMADMTTKQIQDIVPGDRVLGADTNCNAFPVRVLNTFKNGDKEVYRTEFRYPYQTRPMLLESSLDHKILSSRFTTGQRSDVDNYIPTVSPVGRSGSKVYAHPVERIQCETSPGPGRDFAFLIGYLIGNGCYTEPVTRGGGGPMLSCASESTLICLREAAAKFGYSVNFHKGSQCYYRLVMDTQTIDKRDEATGRVLPGVRNIFKKWLRDRGMWCKYSYEKVLPEDVKRWDDDSLRGILQGLFASDGTAYELESAGYPHVGYGSTSRELVEQIMWLLQFRVGVYPGELATSRLGDRKHAMHSINISHLCLLRRFLDWIGTIPGDRGVRLHRSVSAAESLRRRGVGYYARRHSQNRVGVMSTYDLEVDHPDHLFVLANGLIVSNSAKHSGGAAGDEKTQPGLSGFALVERLANPPKEGRGLAIHAQHDGKVQDVRPAPQGGTYLTIGGKEHYVPADFTMTVRQGDVVEAGDELTDGVADPAEVVRLKGIGEGRRYFVNSMRRALQESGAPVDRRNLELLATGLINRVRIDRQFGEFMPGSLVSYGRVEKLYRPRKDSQRTALEGAAGRYLERPALHYSIGTRLTPKILDGLKRGGIKEVVSHTEVPPFTAVPVRAADALQSDPDFMTQFFGSHLQKNLLKSIQAGGESDENSTSFVPLRAGGVNLGRPGFLLSGS